MDVVQDADVEAATIVVPTASGVVPSAPLSGGHATDVVKAMLAGTGKDDGDNSFQPSEHERMATTVLRSCRADLGRAVPRTAIWHQRRPPINAHASSPSMFYSGDVAGCVAMKRERAAHVSWNVLPLLSELTQTGVASVAAVLVPSDRLRGTSARRRRGPCGKASVVDKTASEASGTISVVEADTQDISRSIPCALATAAKPVSNRTSTNDVLSA